MSMRSSALSKLRYVLSIVLSMFLPTRKLLKNLSARTLLTGSFHQCDTLDGCGIVTWTKSDLAVTSKNSPPNLRASLTFFPRQTTYRPLSVKREAADLASIIGNLSPRGCEEQPPPGQASSMLTNS